MRDVSTKHFVYHWQRKHVIKSLGNNNPIALKDMRYHLRSTHGLRGEKLKLQLSRLPQASMPVNNKTYFLPEEFKLASCGDQSSKRSSKWPADSRMGNAKKCTRASISPVHAPEQTADA
jgi:hypothetical protein